MKFALPLVSALTLAAAAPIPFTSCGGKTDIVSVQSIDIDPAPKAGATIKITATGTSGTAVADGTFNLEADYLGIPAIKQSGDICSASAPIQLQVCYL